MGLHPAPDSIDALVAQRTLAVGTHALALVSLPLSFLGCLALYQRLRVAPIVATSALVAYGFGLMAVLPAGVVNGFVAPALATQYHADPGMHDTLIALLAYNHHVNRAFATTFMISTSTATVLWSLAIVRSGAIARWAGWLGAGVGISSLAAVVVGALDTSVRGFGLFVLAIYAWVILVGALLVRTPVPMPTGAPGGSTT